jgi:class 3 adenylate cyclase
MPGALARHHAVLQRAIEANGGYVFQIIGDAFCAAFHTVQDGLAAALNAQRMLRAEAWGDTGAIRVRMALHAGAADVRAGEHISGEYVSGLTLSRAARLLSAGHGGQVLLSLPAAELVQDQLPKGVTLRDLGARRGRLAWRCKLARS